MALALHTEAGAACASPGMGPGQILHSGFTNHKVILPSPVSSTGAELGMKEMTTPETLPGGYYQREGCFQDSSPAHTHPRQLEDSR